MKKNNKKIVFSDPNAKAMWSRNKNIVYRDRTKYTRKVKYKNKVLDL